MRSTIGKLSLVFALVLATSGRPAAERTLAPIETGPAFESIGPLTFGPTGILFAADTQAANIFALDLGDQAKGGAPGAVSIPAIDQKIAGLLGTDVREVAVTDLAVHPQTRNAYLSVMRGQGTAAASVLLRIDGAGKMEIVSLDKVKYSKVALPNAPAANPGSQRNPRVQSVTDMAFVDGRLYVAGLSNEEFASKLRSVPYPFATVDNGTSVEIYHGAHGAFETRSPVHAFVPYTIDNTPHLIAGYLCTPLVKFPVSNLKPGAKVLGTTIAELGNGNRPIDMIIYRKDGKSFLLMANTSRGVMKIPTADFGKAEGITSKITDKAGIAYETIATMKGIVQLDLLNDTHSLVLARTEAGALNLEAVPLP